MKSKVKYAMIVSVLLSIGMITTLIPLNSITELPQQVSTAMTQDSEPTTYLVEASIDPLKKQVTGKLTVKTIPKDSKNVFFHLYPNAFRSENSKHGKKWDLLLGKDRLAGGIDITAVKVMGQPVPIQLQGEDKTILAVKLPDRQKKTAIELSFDIKVPRNSGRFSYNQHALWLGNWLPILAVKDAGGWRLDPYLPIGDPFYSETALYQANITLPSAYTLVTTGDDGQALVTHTASRKQKEYRIKATNVRDFAVVVLDNTYTKRTSKQNGTTINTWYQKGDNVERTKLLHKTAVAAMNYYHKEYGAYPYSEFDVVKTGGNFGGMEYPGLVFVQNQMFSNSYTPGGTAMEVVAHETAHQWFYALVGNDQIREAWIDESLATYASLSFLQKFDPVVSQHLVIRRKTSGDLASAYADQGMCARKPLDAFTDPKTYSQIVYSRGAAMWWSIREAWGEKRLNEVLKTFVAQNRFSNVNGGDLIQAFSLLAGVEAEPFFQFWLNSKEEKRGEAEAWLELGKEKVNN